ncbi:hypothetical protein ANO11243_062170 [Dothideomycetidae sp. 11243]|nr:hypothetical protein ANO11243_062170 [fungal sp. No.11243]
MATESLPWTMRVWQYYSTKGGLEKNLRLSTSVPLPKPKPDQHLIQVIGIGLNPVDYKPAETPLLGRFAIKKPATPGLDMAGRIVIPADNSPLQPGQLVFGAASANPIAGGGLAGYVAAPASAIFPITTDVPPLEAAGVPIAAVSAYGSIIPYIKSGSRVFLNGGSGGTGTFGIQLAKAAGAHVTVSCSGRNADLCRSLGADEVLDYTARPLLDQLRDATTKPGGRPFDHVVDNVFNDPALYFQSHTYTTENATFVEVAGTFSLAFVRFFLTAHMWPTVLGGGKRKFTLFSADFKKELIDPVINGFAAGTFKTVVDRVFPMEEAVEAFKHLKSGRARGKIIVNVAGEGQ